MASLRQSALGGARWTGISSAVIAIVQLVQLTVLARLLTPGDFGLMGMLTVTLGFAQPFADVGISAAVIHRQDVSRRELSSLYWLNILAAGALYLLVLALTPLVAEFFHEARLRSLLPVVAVTLVLGSLGSQFQVLFRKELKFDLLARRSMASAVIGALVAIAMAFAGFGVWSLVGGAIANTAAGTMLVAIPGLRLWAPMLRFSRSDVRPFVGFGAFQMGERLVNIFNGRVDQLLIGSMLGAHALGFYNFSYQLVIQPTSRINPIVTAVAFPVFARMQHEQARLRRAYLRALRALTAVNAPLLLGLAVVAPLAVPVAFGERWTETVPLIQILCGYSLIRSTGNPVGSLLLARGRADLGFAWNVALLAVTAPAVYLGGRLGGVVGVGVALVTLQGVLSVANYRFLIRRLIGPCLQPYLRAVLGPTGLALLMAVLVLVTGMLTNALPGAVSLGIQIVSGAGAYAFLAWTFEKDILFDLASRTPSRGVTKEVGPG